MLKMLKERKKPIHKLNVVTFQNEINAHCHMGWVIKTLMLILPFNTINTSVTAKIKGHVPTVTCNLVLKALSA